MTYHRVFWRGEEYVMVGTMQDGCLITPEALSMFILGEKTRAVLEQGAYLRDGEIHYMGEVVGRAADELRIMEARNADA